MKQFIIAFELLLERIEQREDSNEKSTSDNIAEHSFESRLLTAPDDARILNIRKCTVYRLIQLKQIPMID